MVRYAQHSDDFKRILGSLSINTVVPNANPLIAPSTFIWTSLAALSTSLFLACPVVGVLDGFTNISSGQIFAGHLLVCVLIYFAWLLRQWSRRRLVRDKALQEIAFESVARLSPYVDPTASTTIFSLPMLCDVSAPLQGGGRVDLLFSREGRTVSLDLSIGPWDPLDPTERFQGHKHKDKLERRLLVDGPLPEEFAEFVSKALAVAGVALRREEAPSGASELAVISEHRPPADIEEGARRVELTPRVPLTYRDVMGSGLGGSRVYHVGIYWFFTFLPLMFFGWGFDALTHSFGMANSTRMGLVILGLWAWTGGWLVWHPPVLAGRKPIKPRARQLAWDGQWLREVGTQTAIDLDRPFGVQLTREPPTEGTQVRRLGVLLSQAGQGGQSAARIRFAVAVRESDALQALPELASQAAIVDGAAFRQWLWPLISHRASIHGQRLALSVASPAAEALAQAPVVQTQSVSIDS